MKNVSAALILFILATIGLFAQLSNISEISNDDFPWLRTHFIQEGSDSNSISLQNFEVIENKNNISEKELSNFKDSITKEQYIIIAIDASLSMNKPLIEDSKVKAIDMIRDTLRNFIKRIELRGKRKISIMKFSGYPTILCEFTNDRQVLLDALNFPLEIITNINALYFGRNNVEGIIEKFESLPDSAEKISFCFTDGDHENNFGPLQDSAITAHMIKNNAKAYHIIYNDSHEDVDVNTLSSISHGTNGHYYEYDEYNNSEILTQIDSKVLSSIYELSWLSNYPCSEDDLERDVQIFYNHDSNDLILDNSYKLKANKIPIRSFSEEKVDFGNPEIGEEHKVIEKLSLTVDNIEFVLNEIYIEPKDQGFKIESITYNGIELTSEDTVNVGTEIDIGLSFTQFNQKKFRESNLYINDQGCEHILPLTAGEKVLNVNDSPNKNIDRNYNIFPNPVKDYLFIKIEQRKSPINIHIKNLEGKVVYQETHLVTNADIYNINVKQLEPGVYFLNILSQEYTYTQKLIILP